MILSELKIKLQPFLLRRIEPNKLKWFTDADFVDIQNLVAKDFNSQAQILIERYYKKTTDQITNYSLAGEVLKILQLKYYTETWLDELYVIADEPGSSPLLRQILVWKEAPGGEVQMDIHYLREVREVEDDGDEIDLPVVVLDSFIELLKVKLLVEISDIDPKTYQAELLLRSRLVRGKLQPYPTSEGIRRNNFYADSTDDNFYIVPLTNQQDQSHVSWDVAEGKWVWVE